MADTVEISGELANLIEQILAACQLDLPRGVDGEDVDRAADELQAAIEAA